MAEAVGRVVDRAVQICGSLGASDDLPLAPLPRRGARVPDLRRAVRDAPLGDRPPRRAPPPARAVSGPVEVVDTPAEAAALPLAPLWCAGRWRPCSTRSGLGRGPLAATRIGAGHSNVTYLLERGGAAPRAAPAAAPAAAALGPRRAARGAPAGRARSRRARVPRVLAVCQDEAVLGVPFYVMEELDGRRRHRRAARRARHAPRRGASVGHELVDALVELHAVDSRGRGPERLRPPGRLPRAAGAALRGALGAQRDARRSRSSASSRPGSRDGAAGVRAAPASCTATTGSATSCSTPRPRVLALLDWELATLGDPLADLGYLVATYSDARRSPTVLDLSPVTRRAGFPTRAELVERYAERSGREVGALAWYEALALWKAAVFCEGDLRPLPARRDRRRLGGEPRRGRAGACCGRAVTAERGADVTSRRAASARSARGRAG